jgi:hypothetical protein
MLRAAGKEIGEGVGTRLAEIFLSYWMSASPLWRRIESDDLDRDRTAGKESIHENHQ